MGYETQIVIGYKSDVSNIKNKYFCLEIARFRLGKIGHVDCFKEGSDYYFYEGNKAISKDAYGDPVKMCSLPDLKKWINSQNQHMKSYLAPMKAYIDTLMKTENREALIALHYGY